MIFILLDRGQVRPGSSYSRGGMWTGGAGGGALLPAPFGNVPTAGGFPNFGTPFAANAALPDFSNVPGISSRGTSRHFLHLSLSVGFLIAFLEFSADKLRSSDGMF